MHAHSLDLLCIRAVCRWQLACGEVHKPQEGGSLSEQCALCPVRHGAFKKTTSGQQWVHVVCALWNPETSVLPGG